MWLLHVFAPGETSKPQRLKRGQAHTARLKSRPPELQELLHKLQSPDPPKKTKNPHAKAAWGGTRAKNQRKERFLTPQSPFGMTILVNSNRDGQKQIPRGARDDRELYFFHS
jgi:hypothetical protein